MSEAMSALQCAAVTVLDSNSGAHLRWILSVSKVLVLLEGSAVPKYRAFGFSISGMAFQVTIFYLDVWNVGLFMLTYASSLFL